MNSKEEFLEIYKGISRKGAGKMLGWLEGKDFFTAPASTRFHECCEGGLCEHSVRVYHQLKTLLLSYPSLSLPCADTAPVVALLHDVCKVGCYKTEMRNRKNEQGKWESVPFYTFQEDACFGGHGSKSVYLVRAFMPLTFGEAAAINCHMGVENGNFAVNDAFRQYPLAFLLHTADMASTIPGLCEEEKAT